MLTLGMKAARSPFLTLLALGGAALTGTVAGTVARAATASLSLPGGWQGKLAALVPQPGQLVQLMEQRPSLTLVELQRRVIRVGGSPEALSAVMESAAKGLRPTYDERLGISRDEFRSYLVFQPVLTPTGKSLKLPLAREGSRLKFGDAPGLRGVLKGLVLDLGTGELRTPEGFAGKPRPFVPSSAQDRSLDIRGGFEWNIKGNSPYTQNGVDASLQLVQLTGGQMILKYSRLSMLRGTINEGGVIFSYSR